MNGGLTDPLALAHLGDRLPPATFEVGVLQGFHAARARHWRPRAPPTTVLTAMFA